MKRKFSTRILRREYGLTQSELAEKFDIPLRTVQNWESRKCCPCYVFHMIDNLLAYEAYDNRYFK